ncbi:AEC family transporter [Natronobiforma cellulositropha]|uniref:AEC family transporter n=1 Tax=Natronobiforma cellulositropha TaxID=1679076 RepID=UPI0021D5B979|nr:AEC family transporter [Natronobiforma cellulositropha]
MEVVGRLVFLLVLVAVGVGLRASGHLGQTRTARLNAVAYFVALPALIFVSTAGQAVGDLLTPTLLAGLLVVFTTTVALAWVVHRKQANPARRSVAIVQSYHSNLGYLGVPLIAATFDAEVTAIASVILGVVSFVQLPTTILFLSTINGADVSLRHELGRLARNPVLLALVAGLTVGSVGLTVPGPATAGLETVGALALPLALLCVGASLRLELPAADLGATGSVVALNVLSMPVLAWAVFSLLAVDSATFAAAVVMLGTPTAVSTFVFASELGGDEAFASRNVFATTVVSILTLIVIIALVS